MVEGRVEAHSHNSVVVAYNLVVARSHRFVVAECKMAIEAVAVMIRWLPHNWGMRERFQV